MTESKFDLFISYSRDMIKFTLKLVYLLESYGVIVWFDQNDVHIGCYIKSNLVNVIVESQDWLGMVAIINISYLRKEWCLIELREAERNKVNLYPLLIQMEKTYLPHGFDYLKKQI